MDISKLRNYLGHDCIFNVKTDAGNRAISFEYGTGNNLVEICLVAPNANKNIYHTILRIDGSNISNSKNYLLIDELGVSIRTSLTPTQNILYIIPNDTNLYGDWEIYLRVFGDTDLKLPPEISSNTSVGTEIPSYISVSDIKIGEWSISEDSAKNLVFHKELKLNKGR